jgi:uncharacterized membrane protein YfcA
MTDDRRPRTPWVMWLLVGIGALLGARILLAAASRVLDLAFTVVGLAAVVIVMWRLSAGGRRDRRQP